MELQKLVIPCVSFKEDYETQFAKIERYKHLRVTSYASEPVRLYILWSYDGEEECLENSMRLSKDKWATDKMEVVAPYCKIKAVAEGAPVEKLIVNVLGRHNILSGDVKKEVKYEEDEPAKPEGRHKSPFHRFVSHKRAPPQDNNQKVQVNDPRFPTVMFKNSLVYVCATTNVINTLPFPPADGNQYALVVRNNLLEWKESNQL